MDRGKRSQVGFGLLYYIPERPVCLHTRLNTLSLSLLLPSPLTGSRTALIESLSLIKRNAMAAPFEQAFAIQQQMEKAAEEAAGAAPPTKGDVMAIRYRDDEAFYVIPSVDRVTVVFSTVFKEETDRIFGKVFLQVGICKEGR